MARPAPRGAQHDDGPRPAGLGRVLAACAYDGILTIAILFVATAFALLFTGGEAVPPGQPLYKAWLLVCAFPYFGWCWVRGGQTLGMRAWGLRLKGGGDARPGWGQALARYLGALLSWTALGLGFLWILVDRSRLSWHDRLSRTRIVLVR